MTAMSTPSVLLVSLLCLSPLGAEDFWAYWGDSKAEMDGYQLTQPRYGQIRQGRAVMIFVTEDHSKKEWVKIEGDPGVVPASDRFPVLKLNFIRTFQTGIYDYKILDSVFARLDKSLEPSKISLSVQEWCGHVYHQMIMKDNKIEETLRSYFGGEADKTQAQAWRDKAIFEDGIPILIRELKGPWIKPGSKLEADCAPSLLALRLLHKPFAWQKIAIAKAAAPESMKTVLGQTQVYRWTVRTPYFGTYTYFVEAGWPHRIVKWTSDQGEAGTLTGSTRLPYWKLHDNGDEKYLKDLGF